MNATGWPQLLAAADAIRGDAGLAKLRVTGVGWATVEAERAFAELGSVLAAGGGGWVPQERETLVGASAWRREPSPDPSSGVALYVLEPDTEGRLAANLARFGEGVGVVYVAGGGEADRIVPVSPRWGPYAIVRSRSG